MDARRNVLYICNRFDNDVWAIDGTTGKCLGKASAVREPIAAVLTPDGKWLYVGNHLPAGAINVGAVGCEVSVIDTATMRARASVQLPNGSTGLRGVAASPDGKYVYVSHILARYTVPTTQLDRGWMNTNALSIIDVVTHQLLDTVLLDDVDRGAANPWAIASSSDGKTLFVTHAGTDELSVIDVDAMLAKIKDHPSRQRAGGKASGAGTSYGSSSVTPIPNQLSFLKGVRQRVRLKGKGPRALAVLGGKAYVAEYFTGTMTVVDAAGKSIATTAASLGSQPPLVGSRRGEMLFNDASLCFQQWQSCASCHPDARVDALNWDLLNDGIGNPKQTKSMLYSHRTPPVMITGVRARAEVAVRAGLKHIQFAVREEVEAEAIDAYLASIKPVPSPYLVNGRLSEAARRGEKVF
ncbi:MAG: cell surface protein, partial [bacterium]|nr:cell surface protein [bacterium]